MKSKRIYMPIYMMSGHGDPPPKPPQQKPAQEPVPPADDEVKS